MFNIDRDSVIENAPVKHQCSGSYFYGDDENLEKAIQLMEQAYAGTLRRVRDPRYVNLLAQDEVILKRFWLLQYLRTEAASRRAVEMTNQLGELVGADQSYRLEIREAVLIAMKTFAQEMQIIDDLRSCLVKNLSTLPFITSDDPAVLTNRWFKSDSRHRGSTFGLGSAGIIAILPLSERLLFIAYDADVYAIAKASGIFKAKRIDEIKALNQLQMLHCRANIFPGSTYTAKELSEELRLCRKDRIDARHVLHYSVLDSVEGEYKRYRVIKNPCDEEHLEALVHSQALFPSPAVWPHFLQWRRKGFGMVNGTGIGCIRQSRIERRGGQQFEKMSTRH